METKARNLVVCFDGTGNRFDATNTNVVRLYRRLVRDQRTQFSFYDPGPGTHTSYDAAPGLLTTGWLKKLGGQMFGRGYLANLIEGYRFLMSLYREGDRVYLFGFSRGAFTARALAGMLCRVGLLQMRNHNLIPYALGLYDRSRDPELEADFTATFGRPCVPHFVGVWDTVKSLGWLTDQRQFTDLSLNPAIPFGYHAISLDERRGRFPVTLWDERAVPAHQTVEQVWFAGCHSDVGGGYRERGLSDIAAGWMMDRAMAAGLYLVPDWWEGLDPNALGVHHDELAGNGGLWRLLRHGPRAEVASALLGGAVRLHRSVADRRAGAGYAPVAPLPEAVVEVTDQGYDRALRLHDGWDSALVIGRGIG